MQKHAFKIVNEIAMFRASMSKASLNIHLPLKQYDQYRDFYFEGVLVEQ